MTRARRQARIVALKTLYELDCTGHKAEDVFAHLAGEEELPDIAYHFSKELVKGVLQYRAELDALMKTSAPSYPPEQMPIVDRTILRMAIFEILFSHTAPIDKTPFKVAINEAIELAKEFGGEASPRLIHGALGAITDRYLEVEPGRAAESRDGLQTGAAEVDDDHRSRR